MMCPAEGEDAQRSRLQRLAGLRKLHNVVEKGAGRTAAYPEPHLGPGQRGRAGAQWSQVPEGRKFCKSLENQGFRVWRKSGAAQVPPCWCFITSGTF